MQEHDTQVIPQNQNKCKNKSFTILEEEFEKYNWSLHINEPDHIVFKSPISDYDYYEIYIDAKKIYVAIPLKNSIYKYKTSFDSYFQASEYVEMHFKDFVKQ